MGTPISLEEWKEILSEDKLEMRCALIVDLEVSQDRSVLRADVSILPEQTLMTVKMSWDLVGPDSGLYQFPSKNDLVLVAFCEDNENEGFVMKRLSTIEDKIPLQAVNGHLVLRSRNGTKTFINSDQTIHLTNANDGDEALVLGNTFQTAYSEHLDIDARHTHIGNMGFATTAPIEASEYTTLKASPVDDDAMLSDKAFTEKG